MADWLLSYFPPAREYDTYVEPFGGSASVLMRNHRSVFEIYNDLDGEIVNVFQVLRDPDSRGRLEELLRLTPYCRDEFEISYQSHDDPVEQARRTVYRSFSGFGSAAATKGRTGFRSFSGSSGRGVNPAAYWSRYPNNLAAFGERLSGVVIESRPALDVMLERDAPRTLHYLDPPYLHGTRAMGQDKSTYRHEMDDSQHQAMLEVCRQLEGFVVISGYPSNLYQDLLSNWQMVRRNFGASGQHGTVIRTECLWLSPRVVEQQRQGDMLSMGGCQ